MTQTTSYDVRSMRHEERMLSLYRRSSEGDADLLQPLANSCVRAASFEWTLSRDAETVKRLWGEAARALALGFTRKPEGFDPSPDQFILAINLSIAGNEAQSFTSLARMAPGVRSTALQGARAFRGARGQFHLSESYALIAGAILERRRQPALSALQSLNAAAASNDEQWWQQRFPDPSEAVWLAAEQKGVCRLLSSIIEFCEAASQPVPTSVAGERSDVQPAENLISSFQAGMDETLSRLAWYVDSDTDHHPKLYFWLPGIALCKLAAAAGMPMGWVEERHISHSAEYSRLPLELLFTDQPEVSEPAPAVQSEFRRLKS